MLYNNETSQNYCLLLILFEILGLHYDPLCENKRNKIIGSTQLKNTNENENEKEKRKKRLSDNQTIH